MKYFILCFSLIILPLHTSAEESRKPYWVVGSFDSMQGATDERRRLEYETGLPIQIATVNEGTTFRIVVAKTEVSEAQLEIEGIEPWTLSFAESFLGIPLEDIGETSVMDYYLVLSSFKHADRAHSFAEQVISTELQPVAVSMTELNDETLYRVVHGPFDQRVDSVRNSYNNIVGDDTWWLLTARPEPAQSEPVMQATATTSLEPSTQESELRGPETGESYVDYCATRANSAEREAFCSDVQVEREITKTIELLSMNDQAYVTYCTNASGKDRMKYCTDGFYDRRAGR